MTDDKDRTLLNTILEKCYCPEIVNDSGYMLSSSGLYFAPGEGDRASYIGYIESLPIIPLPEAFGLHENADITKDQVSWKLVALNGTQCHICVTLSPTSISLRTIRR